MNYLTAQTDNYKIEIDYDQHFENPFKEWDGMPLIWHKNKRWNDFDNKEEAYNQFIIDLDKNLSKDDELFDKIAQHFDENDHYYYYLLTTEEENKEDKINNFIEFFYVEIENIYISDIYSITQEFTYNKDNYTYELFHGYRILFIFKDEIKDNQNNYFDLLRDFIEHNVFEYKLFEKIPFKKVYENGREENSYEWELIDSCSGFFGTDFDKNGLIDDLPACIAKKLEDE